MQNELLYIEEHLSCQNYMATAETGFKYAEFFEDTEFGENNASKNYLLFFLKGDFSVSCNQFHNRLFHEGDMILIPRSSHFKGRTKGNANLLSMFFDNPGWNCDKLALHSLSDFCKEDEYNFEPVKIRYPLTPFVELLTYCIKSKMNCLHLHELMQREFFFLIRGFYEKEEIAALFHPIIGKEMDFKDFIMRNYTQVSNIEQLISLSKLGRSRFFAKFNETFGMTAKQWMLKQRNQLILEKLTEPGIYIKDIIEELGFDSQVYFSRYCKQHFGCTPSELIKRCQAENKSIQDISSPVVQNE
ncbi:helix-turn-helix transcriptional regulator [Bacteroides sp. GM023]|uniref:helix-turn-helix transcriptional regulator n=1 Tax=Bacteroides sp. GM023 TaxID=2723058 RepID=UPI00168B5E0D|nr:AraC family transcriptional regulator [Bacteroides sp. GM023]MBD3589610.1 helix-turn-helix transcriptional regulator [Bacteroides sp. GM023]